MISINNDVYLIHNVSHNNDLCIVTSNISKYIDYVMEYTIYIFNRDHTEDTIYIFLFSSHTFNV